MLNGQNPLSVTKVICRHFLKSWRKWVLISSNLKKISPYIYGQWCYRFEILEEIRLHWLFYVGFGEIRILKWHDVMNSNFWFLAILKEFSGLSLFKLIFFPKNKILTKIDISCVKSYQSARPTHPHASIRHSGKIRYDSYP